MKIVAKPWFIPIVLTILILAGSQFYTSRVLSQTEAMTEHEVETQLETMYFGGKVDHISMKDSRYEAEMTRGGSQYKATVDANTGEVLSLTQTKKADLALIETEDKSDSIKSEEEIPADKPITETPTIEKSTREKTTTEKPAVAKPKPDVAKAPENVTKKPSVTKHENVKPAKPTTPVKTVKKAVHLSEQQAIQIALRQLNGEVDDVDFVDTKDGGYYLVEIDIDVDDGPDEATYQIHAISGKVMTVTWDD